MNNKSNLKKNLLEKMAKSEGARADEVLSNEATKLEAILSKASNYEEIVEAIELLDIIVYRVSLQAINILKNLLNSIYEREVISENLPGKNNLGEVVILKSLQVLEKLRYHQPDKVFDIALPFTNDSDETISKQAFSILSKMSEFSINVYFSGENRWSLGSQPQQKVLSFLQNFPSSKKKEFSKAIVTICSNLISEEMEGVDSDYMTMSISHTFVPPEKEIISIRENALILLEELYNSTDDKAEKKKIFQTMQNATRSYRGNYPPEYREMVDNNTIWFLSFISKIVDSSPVELCECMEDDIYRLYTHTLNQNVKDAALEVKNKLDKNTEFQIFKTLIGFEGVFYDWDEPATQIERYSEVQNLRESRARGMVDAITPEDYATWIDRIMLFASVESNDMATFPIFGKFLEYLGQKKPDLAYILLTSNNPQIERFFVSLLIGAWLSNKDGIKKLIEKWIVEGKRLFYIGRFIQFNNEFDKELFDAFKHKVFNVKDASAIATIITVVATHFDKNPSLVSNYFIPAIELLTLQKDIRWVWDFWFRKERKDIMSMLSEQEAKIILDNLIFAQRIEHQLEEALVGIANKYPELVLDFFRRRQEIDITNENNGERFEAIPYEFHSLNEPLSKNPLLAVNIVREMYETDKTLFRFRGARLLSNIFNADNADFQAALIDLISTGGEDNVNFVSDVISNYEGEQVLEPVFWSLIEYGPDNEDFHVKVLIAIQSSGVVHGEFGMAEAYENKIKFVSSWLNNKSSKIKKFAQWFIDLASKDAFEERKRSEVRSELHKLKYGVRKKSSDSD